MEGDLSKHHSTESIISSGSHLSQTDQMSNLGSKIDDCLSISNNILKRYGQIYVQIQTYNKEIERIQDQIRKQKMKVGFQKCDLRGKMQQQGYFMKRQYCPIILKLNL